MADRAYDIDAVGSSDRRAGRRPPTFRPSALGGGNSFSPVLCRGRNAIEHMFCRPKDFRRIATRHHKLAANFLSASYLAATVSYWL